MARIACFSDSATLVRETRLGVGDREHAIYPLPSSQLTDDLRRTVRQLAPDIALLELTHALDNPHLFIFLRADAATRDIPIVVISSSEQLELYAAALGADAYLRSPFTPEQLAQVLEPYIGPLHTPAPQVVELPAPRPARRVPAPPLMLPRRRAAEAIGAIPALAPALALA